MTGNNRNNNGEITFEIVEHIGVIDVMDNREEKWTKEVNLVAWNGGKPKIDIRDWNATQPKSRARNSSRHSARECWISRKQDPNEIHTKDNVNLT